MSELLLNKRLEEIGKSPAKCPICLDDCVDAIELSCMHKFCWKCFVLGPVTSGEYRLDRCPICRAEQPLDPTSNFIIRPAPAVSKVEQTLATVASDAQAGVGYFCFICFEPLALKAQSKTQCMHNYHRECLASVIDNQDPKCPICKCVIVKESWDKCKCPVVRQSWLGACISCGFWSATLTPPEVLLAPGIVMPSLLHLETTGFPVDPVSEDICYCSAVGPIRLPSL